MKLRKENRNSLRLLAVDGALSLRDCGVLSAGLRKLAESDESWAVDLTGSQPDPECAEELERLLLDAVAHAREELWIIGIHRLAHARTVEELETLCLNATLATARQEAWFEGQMNEIRLKTSSLTERLRTSASAEMLALRRENSRLRRRMARVRAEAAAIEAPAAAPEPRSSELEALQARILRTLDHALHPRETS
jgi:hypothetical protein